MKIGMITQFFDPEPGPASLFGELAREFVRRGHDVKVVTGFPNYPAGQIYQGFRNQRKSVTVQAGVVICRVGIIPNHSSSMLGRVANYGSFAASAYTNAGGFLADRDAVWINNSPPTIAPLVRRLNREGKRTVVHVMDIWPENIMSSGFVSSTPGRTMAAGVHRLNDMLFGNADEVLTIARNVAGMLTNRGVPAEKVSYVPMWANEEVFQPADGQHLRAQLGVPEDAVVLLYAGSIGAVQGLDRLIAAVPLLPPEISERLEVWIVGDGAGVPALKEAVDALPVDAATVRLLGRKQMSEMPQWIDASDVSFVGLKPDLHASLSVPSKIQTSLQMGRGIVAAVPGEVPDLINSHRVGFAAPGDSPDDIAQAIAGSVALGRPRLLELGSSARHVYETHFSLAVAADRIELALRGPR